MKNANMDRVLEKAMKDFGDAYDRLLVTINRYEQTTGNDVNNLKGFTEDYPFDKSFDELPINTWVESVIDGLQHPQFKIVGYQYLNTGGNTMVGIHDVWLPEERKVVYVYTNEEGSTIVTVDYIRLDLDIDDYGEFTMDYVDWGRVTGHEKYFELYRRCLNDYTKDDCKYFGITRGLPYHLLSDELQKQVDVDYLVWCEAEHGGLIDTDGRKIVEYPDYPTLEECKATADDIKLQSIKAFKEWHDTLPGSGNLEEMYDHCYSISLAGRVAHVPFDADNFDAIDMLLKRTIEEW